MTAPRFVALLGDKAEMAGEIREPGVARLSLGHGISLWASEHVIPIGASGVVIGHLFTRAVPSARVEHFTPEQVKRIVETSGASLLHDFWGGYVAFLRCGDGEIRVIRDPSGAVPVFWIEENARLIVMSEVSDATLVSAKTPVVDAERLAAFLWAPHMIGAQTCLREVRELLGGEMLVGQMGCWQVSEAWSPWDYVAPRRSVLREDDVAELRDTVIDCVRVWGDCFPSIVLGLSGGLDSSIVAGALRRSTAHLRCLTMIAPGADGDERHYADIVTGTYGLPAVHEHYRLDDIDPGRGFLTHLPWPTGTLFTQGIAATHQRLQQVKPIDAVFSGNGGDMVFCSMHSVTPLVDRLRSCGMPPALWRTALDIAGITGADVFTIFRKAFARACRRRGEALPGGDASFLDAGLLSRARDQAEPHPWLCPPPDVLPGRIAHIAMIKRSQIGHEFYRRAAGPAFVAPLLSQPIMELCLGIPSWEWTRGGVDRSAARRAFHGALPGAIIQRRSKGGPGGFMQQIYQAKCEQIRDMLSDGMLRRLGVLDANLKPSDMMVTPGTASAVPARLMMLAAAEAWARAWPHG